MYLATVNETKNTTQYKQKIETSKRQDKNGQTRIDTTDFKMLHFNLSHFNIL